MSNEFNPPPIARQAFAILRELSEHATPNDRAQLRTMFMPAPPLSFWKMMANVPREQIDDDQRLELLHEMVAVSLIAVLSNPTNRASEAETRELQVAASGDPEQDYFADGVVEEIITALSRLRWLFVIARNSSFTYKGRPVDVRQVGRELGVRYVLEGSVRKSANQVRITGQLIDASTGVHIWADRFDGTIKDIFDLQDQVTASVVGGISPKMEHAEIERARRKPTENLDAYDYYLQGMANVYQATKHANGDALRLFYNAIELDPDFGSAYGMAAWCYAHGWMADRAKEVAETARLAMRAVELGKDDAVALTMGGFALALVVRDVEDGAAFIDRALVLNPNLASGWLLSGLVNCWLGRPEVGIERATRAVRLSPLDPWTSFAFAIIGTGHFFVGRYDEASSWAEKGLREQAIWAGAARCAAASHALAGRLDQAQKAAARVRQIDPTFRVSDFRRMFPFRRLEDIARFEEGLRRAGLPE